MFTTKDFYSDPFYYDKPHKGIFQFFGLESMPGLPEGYVHSMAEWEYVFEPKKNWKPGRSAWALAKYIMEEDGLAKIIDMLTSDFYYLMFDDWDGNDYDRFNNDMPRFVHIYKCIIEKSDPFDEYPNPRKHDLAIYGRVDKKKFKILVEAKVDEPFGPTIEEAYQASLENPNSQCHNRIDELLDRFSESESQREELKQCRYQLLHYLAAATNGKDYDGFDTNFDLTVMLVLVFKTDSYVKERAVANALDFYNFIKVIGDRWPGVSTYIPKEDDGFQYSGVQLNRQTHDEEIHGNTVWKCNKYKTDYFKLRDCENIRKGELLSMSCDLNLYMGYLYKQGYGNECAKKLAILYQPIML